MFITIEHVAGSAIMLVLMFFGMGKMTDFLEQYRGKYTVLFFICLFAGFITIGLTTTEHVHFTINVFLVCLFAFFRIFVGIFCKKIDD